MLLLKKVYRKYKLGMPKMVKGSFHGMGSGYNQLCMSGGAFPGKMMA